MAGDGQSRQDVFISYAGGDFDTASALASGLAAAGIGVWWDADLLPDEAFEQQIQRVLADARLIVAVLSPDALASEWVRWELGQASRNGLHVALLLVDGVRPEQLPPPLHLLPALTLLPDWQAASLQVVCGQLAERVKALGRSPGRHREIDARRRLASAAARTARLAADIKHRKARPDAQPSIRVSGPHHAVAEPPASHFTMSDGFAAFLHAQRIAVAFTACLADELHLLGCTASGQLSVDVQTFRKPMGLCARGGTLWLTTLSHLYRLENILLPGQLLDAMYSHCYVPRTGHFTGTIDCHDIGLTAAGEPLFVATRYNCLAATSPVHSFRPVWRPKFISELVAEDRCHLNGLAMRDGAPAYVTACAATDRYGGWRDHLRDGGIVIDLAADAVVCDGLSMPHSPRFHRGRIWLLDSGRGTLGWVDANGSGSRRFRPVASCPGFARGLAFHGPYALVAVSRPRYDDFAGLDLQHRLRDVGEQAWCGIQVIDTDTGRCLHELRIDGPVREIYDLAVLPDVSCPRSVSSLDDDALGLITVDGRTDRGANAAA